jgi:uracil-DNA glycosylase
MTNFDNLLARVRSCTRCAAELPNGPRPVVQIHPAARILIAGQAPGRAVHASGIPFDDPSGVRLRSWLGITAGTFYDPQLFALVPMAFCYPGSGRSGDLPPPARCADIWRDRLLSRLPDLQLTVVLGQYAHAYHFRDGRSTLTERVAAWRDYWPDLVPLPHPSPRNALWLRRNPWFEQEVLPVLQQRVAEILNSAEKRSCQ